VRRSRARSRRVAELITPNPRDQEASLARPHPEIVTTLMAHRANPTTNSTNCDAHARMHGTPFANYAVEDADFLLDRSPFRWTVLPAC